MAGEGRWLIPEIQAHAARKVKQGFLLEVNRVVVFETEGIKLVAVVLF